MSLRIDALATGRLVGTVYTFENVGDTLPMHRHTDADVHITIVARGVVKVHGPEIGETLYSAGAVMDWQPGVDHEFVAVESNSRIVNIVKN